MLNYCTFKNILGILKVSLILFLFSFLAIFLHEMGHLLVGLALKIKINIFSVGEGFNILSTKIGNIKVIINALPLSGFVKPFVQRTLLENAILLSFGGPIVSTLLFGIVLLIYRFKQKKLTQNGRTFFLFLLFFSLPSFFIAFKPISENLKFIIPIMLFLYLTSLEIKNYRITKKISIKIIILYLIFALLIAWVDPAFESSSTLKDPSDSTTIWTYLKTFKTFSPIKAQLYTTLFFIISAISISSFLIILKKLCDQIISYRK